MRSIYWITLVLTVVGALNWALIALFNFNLVAALFGPDTTLTNLVYLIVGVSSLVLLALACKASKALPKPVY